MTDLPFLINGIDFAALVNKKGYTTGMAPVLAASFTDLAGVDTEIISRWRSTLTAPLNHLTDSQVLSLSEQLMKPTVQVTYYSVQLGATVTHEMKCLTLQNENDFTTRGIRWWDGGTLSFEQK